MLDFDILCFTETHLSNNVSNDDILLEGYEKEVFRKDVSPHSSGFLIYTKDTLVTERKFELEENLTESVWIQIKHRGESI